MNRTALVIALLAAGLMAAAGAGYWYGHTGVSPGFRDARESPGQTPTDKGGRQVLYWYDPMSPQSRFDKPGKSPFMDMQLVPRYANEYANEAAGEGGVTVSPRVLQNLGMRTVEVKRGALASRATAVGSVEYNERSFVVVQPRANGFVERLFVRAPLDAVRQGDPLIEILFPDWAAAQEEYLLLRRRDEPGMGELAAAARQRLVLLGMSPEQIAAVERAGTAQPRFTLRAPVSGVIVELGARQGMTVSAGATLFRIANLSSVWVVAELPEVNATLLATGSRVEVHVPAYPNEKFAGRVSAILPEVNAATRTVRARIEVTNPAGKLRPGMYANVELSSRGREVLLVPTEAVIRTGQRDVVIVVEGEGRFRPVDVKVGAEAGGETEIVSGLKGGEKVVASGQFLIDSEASLRGTLKRLEGTSDAAPAAGTSAAAHAGRGTIAAMDAAQGRVKLDHGAIPSMKWPAMTMGFVVPDKTALARLKPGDAVEFSILAEPDKNGDYVIERISPARPPR